MVSIMIECVSVSKSFRTGFWLRKTKVLEPFSRTFEKGKVTALVGPNGAGKTTLLRMMAGIHRPTEGIVQLRMGMNAVSVMDFRSRMHLGYFPERPFYPDFLTGEEVLKFYASLTHDFDQQRKSLSRMGQLIEKVGLGHAKHRELRFYSKGMLQRIGLAQALLTDPQVLLFDEPMSGLDRSARKDFRRWIREFSSEGKTVILTTHHALDIEECAHSVISIHNGIVGQNISAEDYLGAQNLEGDE